MPFAARVTDMSVTGDLIIPPGTPTVLIGGMPAACVGDQVVGAVCTGAITLGSFTVLIGGRPAARFGSMVVGVNTVTGVPLTTTIGPPCCPTVDIGG